MFVYAIAGAPDSTPNVDIYVGMRRYAGFAFMSSGASQTHFTRKRPVAKPYRGTAIFDLWITILPSHIFLSDSRQKLDVLKLICNG